MPPKAPKPQNPKLPMHYAGKGSTAFWRRVNRLPHDGRHDELYSLGCVLQNIEGFVLQQLENAEFAARKDA